VVEHIVIMAGGAGTRLWPASRQAFPKQFLDLGSGTSLFVDTLRRAAALKFSGCLLVVTHADQVGIIREQAETYNRRFGAFPAPIVVLAEPEARNTGPALAYAAAYLRGMGPGGGSFLVQTADHSIEPEASFAADVKTASRLAAAGYLVTFGITPTRAETGYGYIEAGPALAGDLSGGRGREVARFREKPDRATAEAFLEQGGFYWNSGMFVFPLDSFLSGLDAASPEVTGPFAGLPPAQPPPPAGELVVVEVTDALRRIYARLPSISIDYALMEKHARCAMVPASFSWSDVGSWDEVARLFPGGGAATFASGAEKNFVYSDQPVALAGVKDLIVVVNNGVVLVARRGESQRVKEIVEQLGQAGRGELL
jgi:mannose-1-phosphate guanylyltransferase/mannose-6-phosphate isomerase